MSRHKSAEAPLISCEDGVSRPAWIDSHGERLYYIRAGTPRFNCPRCGGRICEVVADGSKRHIAFFDSLAAKMGYLDTYIGEVLCIEHKEKS